MELEEQQGRKLSTAVFGFISKNMNYMEDLTKILSNRQLSDSQKLEIIKTNHKKAWDNIFNKGQEYNTIIKNL